MKNSGANSRGQSLWSVIRSVMSSMFGVQSSAKHADDFQTGKVSTYIITGVIATIVFVLIIFGIVKIITSLAIP